MVNWKKNRWERISGYLYSVLLLVVIAVTAQALLRSDDDRRAKRSMTVEAVLKPTPVPEPVPATQPRPTNR